MKLLLSCYHIDRDGVSEALSGYLYAKAALKKDPKLTIICREKFVAKLRDDAAFAQATIIGCELPKWVRALKKGKGSVQWYFLLWRWLTARLIRRRCATPETRPDIVHLVIFQSVWVPHFLRRSQLHGARIVWGPVQFTPRIALVSPKHHVIMWRLLHKTLNMVFNWRTEMTEPHAVLWSSDQRLRLYKKISFQDLDQSSAWITPFLDGLRSDTANESAKIQQQSVCRFIYVGRFIRIKAVHHACEAFLRFAETLPDAERNTVELVMVGGGDMMPEIERLCAQSPAGSRVTIKGWTPRKELTEIFNSANSMIFPSPESLGSVIMEAMSFGTPSITYDGTATAFIAQSPHLRAPMTGKRAGIAGLVDKLRERYQQWSLAQQTDNWQAIDSERTAMRARYQEIYDIDQLFARLHQIYNAVCTDNVAAWAARDNMTQTMLDGVHGRAPKKPADSLVSNQESRAA